MSDMSPQTSQPGNDGKAEKSQPQAKATAFVPRLRKTYEETVHPQLQELFKYGNTMRVPRLTKVVLNMGVGEGVRDRKKVDSALEDMRRIAGQQPVIVQAKKSEAGFKLRKGMPIGVKVTLRKTRMYEFVDRLISMALPRTRDFHGLSHKSFDGHGNFSMGIKEHIIFSEIDYDKVDEIRGMNIIICTTANTDKECKELLQRLNFPFRNQ